MKTIQRTVILTVTLLACSLAVAADLRGSFKAPSFERPDYSVTPLPRGATARPSVSAKHTCESEGYRCGSGYSCEFHMSRNFEDALGRPVNRSSNRTNLRFYSCQKTGRAGPPTCSHGYTASAQFNTFQGNLNQLGGVEEYHCQIAQ